MSAPALAIRRFSLSVEAPAAKARPAADSARAAVRDFLPAALAERVPEVEGDSLLLLRKLELDITIADSDNAPRIAARLAEAIAAAIRCAAVAGESSAEREMPGDALPRFASPGARVAAFIAALLENRLSHPWWFRRFEGVLLLPRSAAIRTVLTRDPASIGDVFAALDEPARVRLGAQLRRADAGIILAALAALPCSEPTDSDWSALAVAIRQAAAREPLARAVEALAIASSSAPAKIAGAVASAARAATLYLASAERASKSASAQPRPSRRDGRTPPAVTLARRLPQRLRAALAMPSGEPGPPSPETPLFSTLGGYALLLHALLELDPSAYARDWPPLGDSDPPAVLQLLVLTAAAGDGRLLDDPFWRILLALPPRLSRSDLERWLASAPPLGPLDPTVPAAPRGVALPRGLGPPHARKALARMAGQSLRRFAGRLPGFASASPAFLRSNLLGAGATLRQADGILHVRLERPPLDILLSLTGAAERELAFPDGRLIRLERRR